jgi:hypothetical protein
MRPALLLTTTLALALLSASAAADPGSLDGSWSGSGTVRHEGGTDPVRCKVSYTKSTGRTYEVYANCAHPNGTFQQSGRVVERGGNRYTGRIYSDQYQVTGAVSIRVSGKTQSVSVTSAKGSAKLTLRRN